MERFLKTLAWLGLILLMVWVLAGCGYSDHEPGSFEESAQLLDEHLFQYMDRAATDVLSPTGYLVYVDQSTCSVAGYVRNPYGGWTRAWAEVAPIGVDIQAGAYSLEYRIDSFVRNDLEYQHTYWLDNIAFVYCKDYSVDTKPNAYREGIYISKEHAQWLFENCPVGTPVIIFESSYLPSSC